MTVELKEGDQFASPRDPESGLRFIYEISKWDNSLMKPYVYRQVGDGPLEVVGRACNEIDFSKLIKLND